MFTETAESVTNRIADLGTLQLITTGSGSVEGFGAATVVVGITQDRAVTPCGQGSWTNAATRRISVGGDFLAREVVVSRPERTGVSRDLASDPWRHRDLRWRDRQRYRPRESCAGGDCHGAGDYHVPVTGAAQEWRR